MSPAARSPRCSTSAEDIVNDAAPAALEEARRREEREHKDASSTKRRWFGRGR